MKLAIVCRYLPPRTDGVGDYAFGLGAALAQKGVDVHLVTSIGQTTSPARANVQIHRVVENWGRRGIHRLARWLVQERFDTVNFQYVPHLYSLKGIHPAAAALPLEIRAISSIRVVTTCHELLGHQPRGLKARLLDRAHRSQAALLLAGSDRVIVPAVWQEKRLLQCFSAAQRKVCRIPVGPSIVPVADRQGQDAPLRPPPAEVLLGTFGSGHPWWQYEMALQILKGLRQRGTNTRLLLMGDIQGTNPVYYERLRRLEESLHLEAWTEWTGRLPGEELSRRLASVDLFLALQKTGITARNTSLVSALAHGLAVIATRGRAADPWLIDSGAMRIVDPEDLSAAVETAYALASHPEERQALRRRAEELYRQSFSWEKISGQFLALLGDQ